MSIPPFYLYPSKVQFVFIESKHQIKEEIDYRLRNLEELERLIEHKEDVELSVDLSEYTCDLDYVFSARLLLIPEQKKQLLRIYIKLGEYLVWSAMGSLKALPVPMKSFKVCHLTTVSKSTLVKSQQQLIMAEGFFQDTADICSTSTSVHHCNEQIKNLVPILFYIKGLLIEVEKLGESGSMRLLSLRKGTSTLECFPFWETVKVERSTFASEDKYRVSYAVRHLVDDKFYQRLHVQLKKIQLCGDPDEKLEMLASQSRVAIVKSGDVPVSIADDYWNIGLSFRNYVFSQLPNQWHEITEWTELNKQKSPDFQRFLSCAAECLIVAKSLYRNKSDIEVCDDQKSVIFFEQQLIDDVLSDEGSLSVTHNTDTVVHLNTDPKRIKLTPEEWLGAVQVKRHSDTDERDVNHSVAKYRKLSTRVPPTMTSRSAKSSALKKICDGVLPESLATSSDTRGFEGWVVGRLESIRNEKKLDTLVEDTENLLNDEGFKNPSLDGFIVKKLQDAAAHIAKKCVRKFDKCGALFKLETESELGKNIHSKTQLTDEELSQLENIEEVIRPKIKDTLCWFKIVESIYKKVLDISPSDECHERVSLQISDWERKTKQLQNWDEFFESVNLREIQIRKLVVANEVSHSCPEVTFPEYDDKIRPKVVSSSVKVLSLHERFKSFQRAVTTELGDDLVSSSSIFPDLVFFDKRNFSDIAEAFLLNPYARSIFDESELMWLNKVVLLGDKT